MTSSMHYEVLYYVIYYILMLLLFTCVKYSFQNTLVLLYLIFFLEVSDGSFSNSLTV
jgi:hypothetical protein